MHGSCKQKSQTHSAQNFYFYHQTEKRPRILVARRKPTFEEEFLGRVATSALAHLPAIEACTALQWRPQSYLEGRNGVQEGVDIIGDARHWLPLDQQRHGRGCFNQNKRWSHKCCKNRHNARVCQMSYHFALFTSSNKLRIELTPIQ
jgi:hypothetical protein